MSLNISSSFNLANILKQSATYYPSKTALVFGQSRISYDQLERQASMVANGLRANGIRPGQTVALSCPNLPFFPIVYYGILKTGAIVIPLNILLKRGEVKYHLEDSQAVAFFAFLGSEQLPIGQEAFSAFSDVAICKHFFLITLTPDTPNPFAGTQTLAELMKDQSTICPVEPRLPTDLAVLLYTSGTTGTPKGAGLTHLNLYSNATSVQTLFRATSDDIHLVVLPLFHSFGQTTQMNLGILAGSSLVLVPKFDPETVLTLLGKEKVSIFCGVPTMYWALLNYPGKDKFDIVEIAKHLRLGVSGGSSLPVKVLEGFQEAFGVKVLEGYGLSETSPVATFSRLDCEQKPGSIGIAIPGVEVALVGEDGHETPIGEVGEVVIRGQNVMREYYNKPEETAHAFRGGWFHTGDLARQDEEGYFYIVDRLKDIILRGGYNVYSREVEEFLMTHPAISLVAVVGVAHEEYGEEIKAFVVKKEDALVTEEEIVQWAKEKIASYKYPRIIEFRDSLPMGATGKILKRELR